MIANRPECHLESLLFDEDDLLPCQHILISTEDEEAKEDAKRLLRAGLKKIRKEHDFPTSCPPGNEVERILNRASGHLALISFVVKFIEPTDDAWDLDEKGCQWDWG
jgi:hypothetical protein